MGQLYLEQLLALMTDLETGQRGFVVTGRADFLEPYHQAILGIPAALAQVVEGVSNPLPDNVNWTDFRRLIARRQTLAAAAIADRQLRGTAVLEDFFHRNSSWRPCDRPSENESAMSSSASVGLLFKRVIPRCKSVIISTRKPSFVR